MIENRGAGMAYRHQKRWRTVTSGIEIESWAGGGRRPHDLPDFLASRLALPVNQSTMRWERTRLQQASPILDQLARRVETLFFLLIFLCN